MTPLIKKELGVTWVYWLCIAVFLGMFAGGLFLALTGQGDDKFAGIAASLVFFAFGAGGLAWPLLRSREAGSVATEFVHAFDMHCEGILIPASRVKEIMTLAGSLLLSAGTLAMVLFADTLEHRVKGGLAFLFFTGVFVLSLKFYSAGRKGVLLVPNGIIWREMMRPPSFVEWISISRSGVFRKPQPYSKPAWAFGLDVGEPASIKTTTWGRKRILGAKRKHGWHFHFLAETITVPLPVLGGAIQYYLLHPEARGEIGSATSLARISAMNTEL